ncbi:MAG: right-handed parallel beta-helix repeat-containing protein [Candidatus Eisenbacteria bacterium]
MRRLVLLLCFLVLAPHVSTARTWYVKPDGTGDAPTIQAGIDSAAVGDTVMLADGTYTGDGNRDIIYAGKAVTVLSEGDDPDLCVIDCEGSEAESHRGFEFQHGDGPGALLRGVTIANGVWFSGAGGGGGISCLGGSPTLVNLVVLENRAKVRGGGIDCSDGAAPTLQNVRVVDNVVEKAAGGGVYWEQGCSPALADIIFEGNSATSAGGAICGEYYSERTLSNCSFIRNTAGYGGAVAFCCSDCTFEDCHFVENRAVGTSLGGDGGGALFLLDGAPVIIRCDFKSNSSESRGGAIIAIESRPTLQSCIFDANSSVDEGGSICCDGSECECNVSNCTFVRNLTTGVSSIASGVGCVNYARLSMTNSIIAYSPNGVPVSCGIDSQSDLGCCDLFGNPSGDWVGFIASQYGINGNFSACPSFCNAGLGDFQLCDESPCLPGNHPDGYECGLIGAWGEGCSCGPSQAELTTWGAIKTLFR